MKRFFALLLGISLSFSVSHAGLDDDDDEKKSTAKRGTLDYLKENEAELVGDRVSLEAHGWGMKAPPGVKFDPVDEVEFALMTIYKSDDAAGEIFVRYDKKDGEKLKKKYTASSGRSPSPERLSGVLKKLPGGELFVDISKFEREKDWEEKEGDKKEGGEKPGDKPAEKPGDKPAEKPGDKPGDKPAEEKKP